MKQKNLVTLFFNQTAPPKGGSSADEKNLNLPLEPAKQRSIPKIDQKTPLLLETEPDKDTTVIGSTEMATDEDQASPQASNKIRQDAVDLVLD